jgi:hypothetical protein
VLVSPVADVTVPFGNLAVIDAADITWSAL